MRAGACLAPRNGWHARLNGRNGGMTSWNAVHAVQSGSLMEIRADYTSVFRGSSGIIAYPGAAIPHV
jgi:hypothetical protein